jgi:hypothetical protein
VSVSLRPAKLPELAELLPLDCRSCDTGDSSSAIPTLVPDGGGTGAELDEDDYNRSDPIQCTPTSTDTSCTKYSTTFTVSDINR